MVFPAPGGASLELAQQTPAVGPPLAFLVDLLWLMKWKNAYKVKQILNR